ncbi:Argininosuccinate lyase [Variovorax sp. PBS-H4]|uniref:Bug family tripartite tricarboxylate transporter substrate binding protein n=1 Tax=Variovorax sp. PBS-H4 TaxID=434008 RepID=UPI00131902FE|nr:tripartite tricarboxylate transporter substrate binding protein [Variovorax sp. PBS-H4]VTU18274.1 Argininosuccinate lyase [Variovorax sp. PBS-H4]
MKSFAIHAMLAGSLLAVGQTALAQQAGDSYPSKPVRIVFGFPAGSATDVAARRVAAKLSAELGQSFYVDNRPGANGNIGGEAAAKAPPDGYTLLAATVSEMAINKPAGVRTRLDPANDFIPVGLLFTSNPVLVSSNASKLETVPQLVARAKARPGEVNWAVVNTFQQVFVASFEKAAGVKLNVVPYKGTAFAMTDVVGGQLDGMVGYPAEAMGQTSAGRAKALGLGGTQRNPYMPETPTLGELGYADMDLLAWGGIFAPAGTPRPIVDKLNHALRNANATPDVREALAKTGSEARPYSADQFATFVRNEISRWDKLVRETGVKVGE